ncbi:hypothetical protein [Amycolatopsis sp. PS_44_ISF1]|uniref:hypothetical protein n=1 Tax=Amycolatopsis sp. PS_44_ISF1 TaxID=2974917 RepID=UPI0028DE531F|nr:hypothetical protein [Amycolatopsis sp. PS_44_ISF1]MDT8910899.1 hypothetical protein [Amycolatopsis sp. PS_44_ISF1]
MKLAEVIASYALVGLLISAGAVALYRGIEPVRVLIVTGFMLLTLIVIENGDTAMLQALADVIGRLVDSRQFA